MNHIRQLFYQSLSSNSIIGTAQASIQAINSIGYQNDFKELEDYLNYIFYRRVPLSFSAKKGITEQIAQKFAEAVSKHFDDIISAWNPGSTSKIARNAYGLSDLKDRQKVSISTYEAILKQVSAKMALIKDKPQFSKMMSKLESLENELSYALNYLPSSGGYLDKKSSLTVESTMNNIEILWQAVSYEAKLPKMTEIGGSFEQALMIGSAQIIPNIINKTADDIAEEISNTTTQGSNRVSVSRNLGSGYIGAPQPRTYYSKKTGSQVNQTEYVFGSSSGKSSGQVRINVNSFDGIQQKMDVDFRLPEFAGETGNAFRISAKSWKSMSGKLGETSLLMAFLRVLPIDSALAYGLQLSFHENNVVNLHKFAKYIIALDIIAGVSQANGYADTLVIQDRQQQKIHVYSISNLLWQFETVGRATNFKVLGYQEKFPLVNFNQKQRLGIWVDKEGKNHNQFYAAKIMNAMKGQRVSISFSKT